MITAGLGYVQPELKLMAGTGENDHLDTLDGRYWMQLERRALSRALTSAGAARAAAIGDALAFRRARQTALPGGVGARIGATGRLPGGPSPCVVYRKSVFTRLHRVGVVATVDTSPSILMA